MFVGYRFSKVINVNIHNSECDAFQKIFIGGKLLLLSSVYMLLHVYGDTKRLSRWIIKTTTNIFDIMRKHNQSKAWLEKLMDYNNGKYMQLRNKMPPSMYVSSGIFIYQRWNFSCFQLHVLSAEKNITNITCEITTETVNVTTRVLWIFTHNFTLFGRAADENGKKLDRRVIEQKKAGKLDWN
jgi:hypothetical protein